MIDKKVRKEVTIIWGKGKFGVHCIRCGRILLIDLEGITLIKCHKCKTKNIIGGMYNTAQGTMKYIKIIGDVFYE